MQHAVDIGHDILAVNENGRVGLIAQGHMEHWAVLSDVDALATEHGISAGLDAPLAGQVKQQSQRVLRHHVLGEVQENGRLPCRH